MTQSQMIDRLPPLPEPPHDPKWLWLDSLTGWNQARLDQVEIQPGTDLLALEPRIPGRLLNDQAGTFGGLTLPYNVALSEQGELYLLDGEEAALKRFDPCECRFENVPCLAGPGSQARQLQNPHGIGICRGNIFICDTQNHRLSVFSVYGWALRGHWKPPSSEKLANPWTPYDVAFDQKGRVYVSDPANGSIHRFQRTGRWEARISGLGLVEHLAIDKNDTLYASIKGEDKILSLTLQGEPLGEAARVESIAEHFPRLPFAIDGEGFLQLGPLCTPPPADAQALAFDLRGSKVQLQPNGLPRYYKQGSYLSQAMDSQIYQCQWHRIELQGAIPQGASVEIWTYTADSEHPIDHILALPDDAWQTKITARQLGEKNWDCLIRSGAGRYLWLRLEFTSNQAVTPQISGIRIDYPRISLRRYLPAVFGEEPLAADFTDRYLSVFDTTLRSVESTIDQQAALFDPLSTPGNDKTHAEGDFIGWLASWIGIEIPKFWTEKRRRQYLKQATKLRSLRGTRRGLHQQLLLYLGMDGVETCAPNDLAPGRCIPEQSNCVPRPPKATSWQPPPLILEHFRLRRWLLVGEGRLGEEARLWGEEIINRSQLDGNAQADVSQLITTQDPYRDPFHVYAHQFTVFVPAYSGNSEHRKHSLQQLIETEKPGHTKANIHYVEPRFRIGVQSMVGLDAVIGRVSAGVTLQDDQNDPSQESPLGYDTILTGTPGSESPNLQIGKRSRIGNSTQLT